MWIAKDTGRARAVRGSGACFAERGDVNDNDDGNARNDLSHHHDHYELQEVNNSESGE